MSNLKTIRNIGLVIAAILVVYAIFLSVEQVAKRHTPVFVEDE